jgi:hypothetical protein
VKNNVLVEVDKRVLLVLAADPHGEDLRVGHAGLLRVVALEPDPGDALAADDEAETVGVLDRVRQREGDVANVVLRGDPGGSL